MWNPSNRLRSLRLSPGSGRTPILPTLGGQTALNAALSLWKNGTLEKYGVELIGANAEVIEKAESREHFRAAMEHIGLKVPQSGIARSMDDVRRLAKELPLPLIVRPAFTLGGTGGGVAYNYDDLLEIARRGLTASPTSEVMARTERSRLERNGNGGHARP